MEHPVFEIVRTTTGAISIRNKIVNEIMHNPVGPWLEANSLYIEQSKLKSQLTDGGAEELVVFDVGLGAAANALATLHCAMEMPRKLRLISFEIDLELLRFALAHAEQFEHFKGFEESISQLLENGFWKTDKISWELREGDFLKLIDQEVYKPHLIYFDPYSPKKNRDMWSLATFSKIFSRSRSPDEGATVLYTYSQSTPIRAAMIAAGFFVGHGSATGLKDETTQASTQLKSLGLPFGAKWLSRWKNSRTPFPFGTPSEEEDKIRQRILSHPQFAELKP